MINFLLKNEHRAQILISVLPMTVMITVIISVLIAAIKYFFELPEEWELLLGQVFLPLFLMGLGVGVITFILMMWVLFTLKKQRKGD